VRRWEFNLTAAHPISSRTIEPANCGYCEEPRAYKLSIINYQDGNKIEKAVNLCIRHARQTEKQLDTLHNVL